MSAGVKRRPAHLLLAAMAACLAVGCAPTVSTGCLSDEECSPLEACVARRCIAAGENGTDGAVESPDSASGRGGETVPDQGAAGEMDALAPSPDGGDGHVAPTDARSADAHAPPKPDGLPAADALQDAAPLDVATFDTAAPRPDGAADAGVPTPDAVVEPPDLGPLDGAPPCEPAVEVCDGADNDCDGLVDNLGASCAAGEGQCLTAGTLVCGPADEPTCDARPGAPQAERCDGLDNDCDGALDEDLVLPCYEGPPGTRGVGACLAGERLCDPAAGAFGDCGFQVLPSSEACDGLDNDCDGVADNLAASTPCYEGDPADLRAESTACRGGQTICTAGVVACVGQVGPGDLDDCNGLNDDCDFEGVDEDCQCLDGEPCAGLSVGVCRPGVQICEGGGLDRCDGQVLPAAQEACDGQDDDCDGVVDNGTDAACFEFDPALQDVGLCRAGVRRCVDGFVGPCEGQIGPVANELCNRLDDDCDGRADEGFPPLDEPCTVGLGACQRTGRMECLADASGAACSVERGEPAPEICNGQDDDCDGVVDDDSEVSCYDGPNDTAGRGTCVAGARACVQGVLGPCEGQVTPRVDACDAAHLDEDCDGASDENCRCLDGETVRCGNATEPCVPGLQTCVNGSFGPCEGEIGPSEERCDEVDNDCNGRVDDVAEAEICYEGPDATLGVGLCVAGREACKTGISLCVGQVLPTEIDACDGIDEDCDGAVDEGPFNEIGLCDTNLLGVCASGLLNCEGGDLICRQLALPVAEICNGLDDDCDGTSDDAPVVTRGEFDVDVEGQNATRPALATGPRGHLALYAAPSQQALSVSLRARALDLAGNGLGNPSTVLASILTATLRNLRVVEVPSARQTVDRRYIVAWQEGTARIRYTALGDDGQSHGARVIEIVPRVPGSGIHGFDVVTAEGALNFFWLEQARFAGNHGIVTASMSDDGESVLAPTVVTGADSVRSGLAVAYLPIGRSGLFGLLWGASADGRGGISLSKWAVANRFDGAPVAERGRPGGIVASGDSFAVSWLDSDNGLFTRAYTAALVASEPVALGQSNGTRSAPALNGTADGGLGVLYRESDSVYYQRVERGDVLVPGRARLGSFGSQGADPVLSGGGTAALWIHGSRQEVILFSVARMALGEFLCRP